MAIEGPLRELAISDVLQLLGLSRKTGELSVRRDEGGGVSIFLENGAVVGVRAGGHTRNLGELLLLAGKVSERQVADAVAAQTAGSGALLGAVLVSTQSVAPEDVRRQLRFQVEELVFDLARWIDGHFRFEERPPLDWGPVTIRLSTESLLMEAARRVDELEAIRDPRLQGEPVPRLAPQPGAAAPLSLQPLEWEVLAAVDGERDLRALARELGRGEFEVAKAVFSLVSGGVVALATRRQEPAAAPARAGDAHLLAARAAAERGEWGATLEHLEDAVAADPLLADAHCELGVAAVRLGRLERAEEALRTCLRLPHGDDARRARVERLHRAVTELGDALREVGG